MELRAIIQTAYQKLLGNGPYAWKFERDMHESCRHYAKVSWENVTIIETWKIRVKKQEENTEGKNI